MNDLPTGALQAADILSRRAAVLYEGPVQRALVSFIWLE
jgi:hypothetical protein